MEIWDWVESATWQLRQDGETRLAELIDALPNHVCDNEHEQVDALAPEALAGARRLESPWLEVFVRHWYLQSKVLSRIEVADAIDEAVSLLEFSHGEAAAECPQRVCTVQDLANCYGYLDGPGYVAERLAVAGETLAQIDPSWGCFVCISAEYASALTDGGRYQEALDFIDRQERAIRVAGASQSEGGFRGSKVESLVRLGRLAEAKEYNRRTTDSLRGERFVLSKRIDTARIAAHLGEWRSAAGSMVSYESVRPTPSDYRGWAETSYLLASHQAERNTLALHRQLQEMSARLVRQGVAREAFSIKAWQIELAIARRRGGTAGRCLAELAGIAEMLRVPLDAPERIARLEAAVVEPGQVMPPAGGSPDELVAAAGTDPEIAIGTLEVACERFPDDESVHLALAETRELLGYAEEADAALDRAQALATDAVAHAARMVEIWSGHGWHERLVEVAERRLDASDDPGCARIYREAAVSSTGVLGRRQASLAHLLELVKVDPAPRHRREIVRLADGLGDTATMLEQLDQLARASTLDDAGHWQRLAAAAIEGDHGAAQASALALGVTPGVRDDRPACEGRADEPDCVVLVEVGDASGEYRARRTGPVTARLLELTGPWSTELYGSEVVLVTGANGPITGSGGASQVVSETELERCGAGHAPARLPRYEARCVLRAGGYASYELEGVRPDGAAFDTLVTELRGRGCLVEMRSDEGHTIEVDELGELPFLWGCLAVPETVEAGSVARLIEQANERADHPLWAVELAEAAGDRKLTTTFEGHRERYY